MENFKELTRLLDENKLIENLILLTNKLEIGGSYGDKQYLHVYKESRYFNKLEKIIGEEKLNSIIKQFEGLILIELINKRELKKTEISQYSIIKTNN